MSIIESDLVGNLVGHPLLVWSINFKVCVNAMTQTPNTSAFIEMVTLGDDHLISSSCLLLILLDAGLSALFYPFKGLQRVL